MSMPLCQDNPIQKLLYRNQQHAEKNLLTTSSAHHEINQNVRVQATEEQFFSNATANHVLNINPYQVQTPAPTDSFYDFSYTPHKLSLLSFQHPYF